MDSSVIVAFISGVVGPVLLLFIKNKFEERKQNTDIIKDALAVSECVESKLDAIKEDYKADRVWITQFHNGGHFYPTGKSIAKFTMLYEVVEAGTTSIQSNFQSIPVNLFSKSINRLLSNDVIEIYDYKDKEAPTYGLEYIANENSCKSGYLFAIKNIDGKFVGILGVDYTKKKNKLTPNDIIHLQVSATLLGGVLMTHLCQNS
jgi:hypothetical protein